MESDTDRGTSLTGLACGGGIFCWYPAGFCEDLPCFCEVSGSDAWAPPNSLGGSFGTTGGLALACEVIGGTSVAPWLPDLARVLDGDVVTGAVAAAASDGPMSPTVPEDSPRAVCEWGATYSTWTVRLFASLWVFDGTAWES